MGTFHCLWSLSHSKKLTERFSKSASWPIALHNLCEPDQANRCRELGILNRGRNAPCGLRMRQVRWYLENFLGEMIDAVKKATATGNEDAGAQITEIRLLFEPAFQQLKTFAHSQVNDRV